jgi:hypothetical protein
MYLKMLITTERNVAHNTTTLLHSRSITGRAIPRPGDPIATSSSIPKDSEYS